jgi:acetyltransferase-like isoleucine patch superfamily enzyme
MLCGEPFLPYNEQLKDERARCAAAIHDFNSLADNASKATAYGTHLCHFRRIMAGAWISQSHTHYRLTERVRGVLGGNVNITTPFHCDYGYNVSIGDNVCIGPYCVLLDSARITIGKNTTVGARVTITTLKAPTDTRASKGSNSTEVAQEVFIGENAYIGHNVTIEAGVKIGNNAIIRSGSVVVFVSALIAMSEVAC